MQVKNYSVPGLALLLIGIFSIFFIKYYLTEVKKNVISITEQQTRTPMVQNKKNDIPPEEQEVILKVENSQPESFVPPFVDANTPDTTDELKENLDETDINIAQTQKTPEKIYTPANDTITQTSMAIETTEIAIEAQKNEAETAVQNTMESEIHVSKQLALKPTKSDSTINKTTKALNTRSVSAAATAAEEEIPTEIPPEWNWFNIPLTAEYSGGKITIAARKLDIPNDDSQIIPIIEDNILVQIQTTAKEPTEDTTPLSETTPKPTTKEASSVITAIATGSKPLDDTASFNVPHTNPNTQTTQFEKCFFASTLSKLENRKPLRLQQANNLGLILPSENKNLIKAVSSNLHKLNVQLNQLIHKSDIQQESFNLNQSIEFQNTSHTNPKNTITPKPDQHQQHSQPTDLKQYRTSI